MGTATGAVDQKHHPFSQNRSNAAFQEVKIHVFTHNSSYTHPNQGAFGAVSRSRGRPASPKRAKANSKYKQANSNTIFQKFLLSELSACGFVHRSLRRGSSTQTNSFLGMSAPVQASKRLSRRQKRLRGQKVENEKRDRLSAGRFAQRGFSIRFLRVLVHPSTRMIATALIPSVKLSRNLKLGLL